MRLFPRFLILLNDPCIPNHSKISQFEITRPINKKVLWRNVFMDDSFAVGVVQSRDEHDEHEVKFFFEEGLAFFVLEFY
jgi:hypothetical protein